MLCLISPEVVKAQPTEPTGYPFIETYQRGQFVGARQTWGIIRADDGLLYFGNSRYGIQESDGLSWRNLWMERNSAALSFAKHPDGRIFVGGQADFGVLKRDSLLRRTYHSLAHLPLDSGEVIKDVEYTFVLGDKVHFISPEVWYIYSESGLVYQSNKATVSSAAQWENSVISLHADGLITRTKEANSYPILSPDKNIKPIKLSAVNNRLFLLDEMFNIWEFNSSETWIKVTQLSKDISEASVIVKDFLWSQVGYIHLATSNGLFTYSHTGEYIHTIYDKDGLADNDLIKLYEDDALNIWVSSSFGVSVLEYGRAMREFLPSAHDLPEYSAILKNFNGSLYIGGNNGLYVWRAGKFRQLYNDKSVYAFELTPHGLLIGSNKDLQLFDKQGVFHTIFSGGRVDLILADRENPSVVYYSHDANALRKVVLQSKSTFKDTKLIDFKDGGYTITEDINGDLWIGTGRNGDFHFATMQEDNVIISVSDVRQFTTNEGLPSNGFNYTMSVGKDVGFITSDGFYKLTSDRDSVVIDHRFDEVFSGQDRAVWPVVQDNAGGIWLAWAAAHIGKAVYNSEKNIFEWYDGEFTRTAPYWDIDFIYPTEENRIYFQTFTQRLAYFDSSLYKQPLPDIKAHVNSVVINSDSLISEPRGLLHTVLETPISFADNKIRINYGMIAFLPEDRLFYQIKLEGLDDDWSAITSERYQDYTNLKEGKYTFWVRGHTLYPDEAQMASFSFVVLPPWYRTWWAYALYILIGLGSVFIFVKAREKGLLKRQKELENEVLVRTEEIRNQKEKLEKTDEIKNTFFSNVSHEFRTPLTISSGLVDKLLKQKEQDPSNVQYDLSIVKRNMVRLDDMVSQIIDLTKSDQNHLTLNKKHYKADNLVSISVESFRSLAEYHGHKFEFYPNAEDITLHVDRAKVEIMINNLISNAIKFTPDGGTIIIETQVSENLFELRVQDSGSGIPEGKEEAVFERFHRLKRDAAHYVEGMGVGLELSRVLARLHSGDIEVDKSYKEGARFRLLLPIAEINGDDVSPIPDSLDEELLYVQKDSVSNSVDQFFEILLVEDNADMMEYVSGILSELGTIKKASNGKEALKVLEHFNPDIIVTDLMMPVMGGLELVEKLKNHEKWNTIPTIVLTAKALEKDKLHLMRIGVVDYITKPFVPEQLVLKVKNLLSYYTRRKSIRVKLKAEEVPKNSTLSEKTASFISKNLANTNLSVDMLADEFSQSRRSFYRNLQIETGMSPGEFIREVRLTSARALVAANKNYRLEELATAVGYKSATSFRKIYEERFGVHPLS